MEISKAQLSGTNGKEGTKAGDQVGESFCLDSEDSLRSMKDTLASKLSTNKHMHTTQLLAYLKSL